VHCGRISVLSKTSNFDRYSAITIRIPITTNLSFMGILVTRASSEKFPEGGSSRKKIEK